jgi:O-antigen/teichoic acid export membrane protein
VPGPGEEPVEPESTEPPNDAGPAATSQIRGSSVLLVGRVLALVITLTTQVIMVRALAKTEYGAFAYALTIATLARTLVSFGEDQALTRFLSIYDEQRDHDKLFGTFVMATAKILATSTLLIGVLFVVQGRLVGTVVDDPDAVGLLLILVFLAPIDAVDRMIEGSFAVFSRPRAIFFRKYVMEPGLRLGVVVLVLALGRDATLLAVGYVLAALAGMIVYALTLRGVLRRSGLLERLDRRRLSFPVRAYFGFSLPLLSVELVNITVSTVSVVLLGRVQGTAEVAEFRAVLPAARLNQIVIFTFTMLFTPMAARFYARGDVAGMREAYWQSAMWLAVFSFPVFALTGPFADPLTVTLFGERYASSAPYLAVLATGYFVNAALGFNALSLQAFGHLGWVTKVNVVVATLHVALALVLVPRHGAMGAAVAIAVTLVIQNLLNQAGLARVGIGVLNRQALPVYGVIVMAGAVLCVIERALSPPLAVAVVLAAAMSLGVLVANRRRLRAAEVFPELQKVPVLRRVLDP